MLETITAANGDQIHTKLIDYEIEPNSGAPYLVYQVTGGTGRFSEASGQIKLFVRIDLQNNLWSNYGEGTITY